MNTQLLVQATASGVFLAATYAIASLGLTVVYGVLGILNFAHAQFLLLGAYVIVELGQHGVSYWIALPLAMLSMALLGFVVEVSLFRPVRGTPINGLIISVGLIAVFGTVVLETWGPGTYPLPRIVEGTVSILGARVPKDRLVIIAASAVALLAVQLWIARSRWGKVLRATAEDEEAALLHGIPVSRVKTIAFMAGCALAALAGGALGTVVPVEPVLGESVLIKAFIVVVIGGAGSTSGAVLGALVVGLAEAYGVAYLPTLPAQLVPLLVLAAVLLIRPQGIFGNVTVRV